MNGAHLLHPTTAVDAVARVLGSLVAEAVSSRPRPGPDWSVGQCWFCGVEVWLSPASLRVLGGNGPTPLICVGCAAAVLARGPRSFPDPGPP